MVPSVVISELVDFPNPHVVVFPSGLQHGNAFSDPEMSTQDGRTIHTIVNVMTDSESGNEVFIVEFPSSYISILISFRNMRT